MSQDFVAAVIMVSPHTHNANIRLIQGWTKRVFDELALWALQLPTHRWQIISKSDLMSSYIYTVTPDETAERPETQTCSNCEGTGHKFKGSGAGSIFEWDDMCQKCNGTGVQ